MTIEIPLPDLSAVPVWAWVAGYLALCWLVIGPVVARCIYRYGGPKSADVKKDDASQAWFFMPILVPLAVPVTLGLIIRKLFLVTYVRFAFGDEPPRKS